MIKSNENIRNIAIIDWHSSSVWIRLTHISGILNERLEFFCCPIFHEIENKNHQSQY